MTLYTFSTYSCVSTNCCICHFLYSSFFVWFFCIFWGRGKVKIPLSPTKELTLWISVIYTPPDGKDKYININPKMEIIKNAFDRNFANPCRKSVTKIAMVVKTNKENSIGMLLPRIMLLATIPRPKIRIMNKSCIFMLLIKLWFFLFTFCHN